MGKNLKGKGCGKGVSQRKDGLYCARFADKCRKRHEKYFSSIPEARNWLDEVRYADKHDVFIPSDMTEAIGGQVHQKHSRVTAQFRLQPRHMRF